MKKATLIKFKQLQSELKRLKEEEAKLRLEIIEELASGKPAGTYNFGFDEIVAKVTKKNNISIDKELFSALYNDMSPAEKNCIKFTPELKLTEYKNLNSDITYLLDECLVTKPAMPTLEIKEVAK